jgi:hypothetical protein
LFNLTPFPAFITTASLQKEREPGLIREKGVKPPASLEQLQKAGYKWLLDTAGRSEL